MKDPNSSPVKCETSDIKSTVAFSLLSPCVSGVPQAGGSQLPYSENAQAGLWRRPCGEGLRPPADSRESEPSQKDIPQPVRTSCVCSSAWYLHCNPMRDPGPELPSSDAPKFPTCRNSYFRLQ